jgi:UDP-N-acetylglucosamine 2-epimerase (non-hydrolysing)
MYHRARCPDPRTVLGETPGAGSCLGPDGFGVVTLHRPSNVDDPATLATLVETLCGIAHDLPLVFPVHPRTRARLADCGLLEAAERALVLLPPLPYLELLSLVGAARLVLTDSGGLQEETTALGVPCLTLRDTTERPVTVTEGTNTVVGTDPGLIRAGVAEILSGGGKRGRLPELWDGHAALRIRDELVRWAELR